VGCHRSSAARRRALSESRKAAASGLSSWRQTHTTDKAGDLVWDQRLAASGSYKADVQVRCVGRGSLRGLTEQVTSPNHWGLALVEELPEAVLPQDLLDLDADAGDAGRTAAVVAGRLSEVMANMNLGSEEEKARLGEGPVMWTHEREEVAESLGQLTVDAWRQRLEDVTRTLRGVPVCTTPQSAEAAVCPSLAVAYAALSFLSLERRIDFFRNEDWDLTKRLEVLEKQMVEVQGMARARKALAGVFTDKSG
ncbi:unnamed protein product, partial [Symbiodinium microadriaticum]